MNGILLNLVLLFTKFLLCFFPLNYSNTSQDSTYYCSGQCITSIYVQEALASLHICSQMFMYNLCLGPTQRWWGFFKI